MSKLSPDAQASEVHESTADASTSPTAAGDELTTRIAGSAPEPFHVPVEQLRVPTIPHGTHIIRDETDSGGPLVIETDDPAFNPPLLAVDPFPTDSTPQIDA